MRRFFGGVVGASLTIASLTVAVIGSKTYHLTPPPSSFVSSCASEAPLSLTASKETSTSSSLSIATAYDRHLARTSDSAPVSDEIRSLRPNLDEYERMDNSLLLGKYKGYLENHVLHDTLATDDSISCYEIYKKRNCNNKEEQEVIAILKFGKKVNGHPGIVHGGITALVFDNTFGWLFIALNTPSAVTANLNINYRAPIFKNSIAILKAKLVKLEGRKIYMTATLQSKDGKLLADSTTLFITPKASKSILYKIYSWFR